MKTIYTAVVVDECLQATLFHSVSKEDLLKQLSVYFDRNFDSEESVEEYCEVSNDLDDDLDAEATVVHFNEIKVD